MAKRKNAKDEICYHIINSLLAAGLVFLGGLSAGDLTWETVGAAAIAGAVVALTKFRDYWLGIKKNNKKAQLFSFI